MLGGGGARGGAHVGVLRILEEMRIPIDRIAGTSMGAVIGGAYASGMTLDEIETLLTGIDWDQLFLSSPPREDRVFRRKEDSRAFPTDGELGFDGRSFKLPTRLIGGHSLNLLLKSVTLPVSDIRDFDDLPIPFRSVATDVETGDVVVLSEGDLARAILASMAIPGAFEPIQIDGRLLVDGGLVRNLPVDVVRDMGADVVIAVDVGSPLIEREGLNNALGVATQMLGIMTEVNSRAQRDALGPDDVLIRPDLGELTLASFPEIGQTIPLGADAARGLAAALRPYTLSPDAYRPYASRVIPRESTVTVDFVELENDSRISDAVLLGLLDIPPSGEITLDQLQVALTRLQGAGSFDKVDFELVRRDGLTGLRVEPIEKPWGPNYLRLGLFLRDDVADVSSFTLATRLTMTHLNGLGAEVRADVQVGRTRRLAAEWYQPLDRRLALFTSLQGHLTSTREAIFDDEDAVAAYRTDRVGLALMVGSRLGLWGQVRAGIVREWIDSRPEVGSPELPRFDTAQASVAADFLVDEHDDVQFPTRGVASAVRYKRGAHFLGGDVAFDRLEARVWPAFSVGRNTVLFNLMAATGLGTDLPQYEHFVLGGLFRLSGLQENELRGVYAGLASAIFYRQVGAPRGLGAIGGLRVGGSLEAGNTWNDPVAIGFDQLRLGGSLFAGLETLIGPIYLGYGRTDRGRGSWHIFLGQVLR